MKISSVRIENFRSFEDETIEFDDYNCLVGPNGAGKSNVLNALNVFFHEMESSAVDLLNLGEEDFHERITSKPIRITATFTDLNEQAKADLKDYVRQDKLVVSAVAEWNPAERTAPVVQHGMRAGMKDFAPFFKALNDNQPVKELQENFSQIQKKFPDLKAGKTKPAMTDALRAFEEAHPDLCELLESADEFYGVSKGANRLAKHVLSEHTFFLELDRSSETQEKLVARAGSYLDYYRSGGFAVRNGGTRADFKEYPFRVLMVFKTAERRNNTAERLLQNTPPILTHVWLSTFAEATSDALGPAWVRPIDYRDVTRGTRFDPEGRRPSWTYARQTERELFIAMKLRKHLLLD